MGQEPSDEHYQQEEAWSEDEVEEQKSAKIPSKNKLGSPLKKLT